MKAFAIFSVIFMSSLAFADIRVQYDADMDGVNVIGEHYGVSIIGHDQGWEHTKQPERRVVRMIQITGDDEERSALPHRVSTSVCGIVSKMLMRNPDFVRLLKSFSPRSSGATVTAAVPNSVRWDETKKTNVPRKDCKITIDF